MLDVYPMNTLGERIEFARGSISQEAFSRELGISKGSLGFYERNENLPNTDVVLKICSKTGVRLEWLLTGYGPMKDSCDVTASAAECADDGISEEEASCSRCLLLEKRLDRLEDERRELAAENRLLWKENAGLRERCARFEEREKHGGILPPFESSPAARSSKRTEKG